MDENVKEILTEGAKELAKESAKPFVSLLNPVCKAAGEGIGSLIDLVFFPVKALNDRAKVAQEKFKYKAANLLNDIPKEKIVEPQLNKFGPILEASKYYVEDEVLSDMFARLLASTCNSDTASMAHVAYVDVIKQLTPIEASIVKELYNNKNTRAAVTIKKEAKKVSKGGSITILKNYLPTKKV